MMGTKKKSKTKSWEHGIFSVSCLSFLATIILLIVLCKRKTHKTMLITELTTGELCENIPLKRMPLSPSYWKIEAPTTIDQIIVSHDMIRPKLTLEFL